MTAANSPDAQADDGRAVDAVGRLRAAAEMLRTRATAATPGPWREAIDADKHKPDGVEVGVWSDPAGYYPIECMRVGNDNAANDAIYIAMMSPPVALALADWLNAEAVECEAMAWLRNENDGVPVRDAVLEVMRNHPANALTDAILGTRS